MTLLESRVVKTVPREERATTPTVATLMIATIVNEHVERNESVGVDPTVAVVVRVKTVKKKEGTPTANLEKDSELLLWLVRLFHADPHLALSVRLLYSINYS